MAYNTVEVVMKTRKSNLAGTWYPDDPGQVSEMLESWTEDTRAENNLVSAVVPHAGWYYSGSIAAKCIKAAASGRDLVIIAGGHRAPGSRTAAAFEESFESPGGRVPNALGILDKLKGIISIEEDLRPDNTVEIIIPAAAYFSPDAEILWLRMPADEAAVEAAGAVFEEVKSSGRNAVLIGSTDLTHYGANYGFKPAGSGPEALEWVKEVNDAEIIQKMLEMDADGLLRHAREHSSACSAGAAASAVEYARRSGTAEGRLVEYRTSYDVQPAESFVGYAGIVFQLM